MTIKSSPRPVRAFDHAMHLSPEYIAAQRAILDLAASLPPGGDGESYADVDARFQTLVAEMVSVVAYGDACPACARDEHFVLITPHAMHADDG